MQEKVIIRHNTILHYPLVFYTLYYTSVLHCFICADVKH